MIDRAALRELQRLNANVETLCVLVAQRDDMAPSEDRDRRTADAVLQARQLAWLLRPDGNEE